MKLHKPTPEEIYTELKMIAFKSATEFLEKYGEHLYCGFAHVNINPARGKFIKYLKDNNLGYKSYSGGFDMSWHNLIKGHTVAGTQSMDLKEYVMQKVADHLKILLPQYETFMVSRPD